jgi:hypothetical protein
VRTNFYNPLYINDDGTKVFVDGPIDWEGGTGQCSISFTNTQGNVQATDNTGNYHPPDTLWDKKANAGGGHFVPGPANAHGVIHGTSTPPPAPWPPQSIELVYARQRNVPFPQEDAADAAVV